MRFLKKFPISNKAQTFLHVFLNYDILTSTFQTCKVISFMMETFTLQEVCREGTWQARSIGVAEGLDPDWDSPWPSSPHPGSKVSYTIHAAQQADCNPVSPTRATQKTQVSLGAGRWLPGLQRSSINTESNFCQGSPHTHLPRLGDAARSAGTTSWEKRRAREALLVERTLTKLNHRHHVHRPPSHLNSRRTGIRIHSCVCQSLGRVRLCDPVDCRPSSSSVHGIIKLKFHM